MKLSAVLVRSHSSFYKKFSTSIMKLSPPNLIDLKIFDRDKFTKTLPVPTITFSEQHSKDMKEIVKNLKKYFIKVEKFRPVTGDKIYLNPDVVQSWDDITSEALESLNITEASLKFENVEFTYQNWRADELVKAIIPDGVEPVTSYSKIGHVIHLNLKDHLLPYKNHIAQIFMDKSPGCRTVINKAQSIDNTFRNFQIELLAGEADYQVETKENGSTFEFDFSTVYWNPRLCGEHERLVKLLNPNDVLLDVFAGVGPFAVPAGKKRVNVFANDLNPHSFQWLQHNVKRNKVTNYVKTFKKDGREFILNDVKDQLLQRIEKRDEDMKEYAIHITMNLPALAVTFIDAFVGLLKDFKGTITIPTPICHCYCFVKGVEDSKVMAKQLVEEHLGFPLTDETLQGIQFVRNVAPNKDMIRVDLLLTPDVLLGNVTARDSPAPDDFIPNKKICNSAFAMGKNKKTQKTNQKSANNSNKKAQQIFKVASSGGGKKAQKKTKEIPKKLKQLDLKTKDKADQQLKNLHLKMVSKKDVKEAKSVAKKKKAGPSTDKVQDELTKMNV